MVLLLSFSPGEVRLPVYRIFSSRQPLAAGVGKRWGWTHSAPCLFLNPLPGWPLPLWPFLPLMWNLIMELSINVCTHLGESGSQGMLIVVLAGEESVTLLLKGAKAWHYPPLPPHPPHTTLHGVSFSQPPAVTLEHCLICISCRSKEFGECVVIIIINSSHHSADICYWPNTMQSVFSVNPRYHSSNPERWGFWSPF